jgi:hypothetical protein
MANNIGANPWKIDTTPFSYSAPVKIDNIVWADAAAGDVLLITDINGNPIIEATAPTGYVGGNWSFGKIGWTRGLVLPTTGNTLGSSAITIAIGAGK